MITLETDRLNLIPFALGDLDSLHRMFTTPFVRKYLWDDEIISQDQVRDILDANVRTFEEYGWGLWKSVLKEDRSVVGFSGFWRFFDEGQPQLLYGVLSPFAGKGYASEASKVVCDYAFNKLGFEHILVSFDTPNTDSRKVCDRLGMQHLRDEDMNGKPTSFYRLDKPATS